MEAPTGYSSKLTLRVVLTCVMAASGGLIFGYDHGVSGNLLCANPFSYHFILLVIFIKIALLNSHDYGINYSLNKYFIFFLM